MWPSCRTDKPLFVKRGALSGTFAGTPQTNDYVRVALPLADDYPTPVPARVGRELRIHRA
jgi:hypothetical protein